MPDAARWRLPLSAALTAALCLVAAPASYAQRDQPRPTVVVFAPFYSAQPEGSEPSSEDVWQWVTTTLSSTGGSAARAEGAGGSPATGGRITVIRTDADSLDQGPLGAFSADCRKLWGRTRPPRQARDLLEECAAWATGRWSELDPSRPRTPYLLLAPEVRKEGDGWTLTAWVIDPSQTLLPSAPANAFVARGPITFGGTVTGQPVSLTRVGRTLADVQLRDAIAPWLTAGPWMAAREGPYEYTFSADRSRDLLVGVPTTAHDYARRNDVFVPISAADGEPSSVRIIFDDREQDGFYALCYDLAQADLRCSLDNGPMHLEHRRNGAWHLFQGARVRIAQSTGVSTRLQEEQAKEVGSAGDWFAQSALAVQVEFIDREHPAAPAQEFRAVGAGEAHLGPHTVEYFFRRIKRMEYINIDLTEFAAGTAFVRCNLDLRADQQLVERLLGNYLRVLAGHGVERCGTLDRDEFRRIAVDPTDGAPRQ